jgi:hypothetical protein
VIQEEVSEENKESMYDNSLMVVDKQEKELFSAKSRLSF